MNSNLLTQVFAYVNCLGLRDKNHDQVSLIYTVGLTTSSLRSDSDLSNCFWSHSAGAVLHVAIGSSSWSSNVVVIGDITLITELSTSGTFCLRM